MACLSCNLLQATDEVVLARTDAAFAVMDKYPLTDGHCLVFPRAHHPNLFFLPADDYLATMQLANIVGRALSRTFPQKRIGMFASGKILNEHAHVHLLAMASGLKATFANLSVTSRRESSIEERTLWASRLRTALPPPLHTDEGSP